MSLSRETLLNCLDAYVHPLIGRGLVAAGEVRETQIEKDHVRVHVELGFPAAGIRDALLGELAAHIGRSLGVDAALALSWRIESVGLRKNLQALPGVRNLIAVSSGKGGVGKSTVAANLALALAAEGARVGVLDADIYGPSQPQMLGLAGKRPASPDGKRMHPLQAYGLQVMSIGFLVDDDQPMIWRGPMATQALNQLLGETLWDNLDYLVVDMPPGTGDIQLTLSQRMPVAGAVIVTTPQDIALLDARKGLQMFRRVEIPVLGIVENMAWHVCSQCGHHEAIFGEGGGARMAAQYGSELLGQLPLELRIREQADAGKPTVAAEPDSELAQRYRSIARLAAARLAYGLPASAFPNIEISDD